MTQFEIEDLFESLGFKCLEDNVGGEVKDREFFSRFGIDGYEIQFQNYNNSILVNVAYYHGDISTLQIDFKIALAIAEQVKFILEEYKGEIE